MFEHANQFLRLYRRHRRHRLAKINFYFCRRPNPLTYLRLFEIDIRSNGAMMQRLQWSCVIAQRCFRRLFGALH